MLSGSDRPQSVMGSCGCIVTWYSVVGHFLMTRAQSHARSCLTKNISAVDDLVMFQNPRILCFLTEALWSIYLASFFFTTTCKPSTTVSWVLWPFSWSHRSSGAKSSLNKWSIFGWNGLEFIYWFDRSLDVGHPQRDWTWIRWLSVTEVVPRRAESFHLELALPTAGGSTSFPEGVSWLSSQKATILRTCFIAALCTLHSLWYPSVTDLIPIFLFLKLGLKKPTNSCQEWWSQR